MQVTFEIADITSCELTAESYDVVYSRDTILHIHDKPALFKRYSFLTTYAAGDLMSSRHLTERSRAMMHIALQLLHHGQHTCIDTHSYNLTKLGSCCCRFLKVLKPGGRLLISDYCKAPGQPSEDFAAYIKQRGYDLHSVEEYGRMLQGAGFAAVKAEDRTWQVRICRRKNFKMPY